MVDAKLCDFCMLDGKTVQATSEIGIYVKTYADADGRWGWRDLHYCIGTFSSFSGSYRIWAWCPGSRATRIMVGTDQSMEGFR
jgi:hypothetical protein